MSKKDVEKEIMAFSYSFYLSGHIWVCFVEIYSACNTP